MTGKPRPWYRWRNVALTLTAVVLLFAVWAFLETLAVYRAEPNTILDTQSALRRLFERSAGVPAAEAEEAWVELVSAFDTVDEVALEMNARFAANEFTPRDEYDNELDYSRVLAGPTLPAELGPERLAVGLLRQRGAFDRLQMLSERGPALQPPARRGPIPMSYVIARLSSARSLAMARAASMRLAAAEGDFEEATAAFDGLLALARTLALQPYLYSYLTAAAIEALALGEMRYGLAEFGFDGLACARLLTTLDRHDETSPTVEHALEAERVYIHDWVQWAYSDDGEGDGYLVAVPELASGFAVPSEQSFAAAALSRFFFGSRTEILTLMDDLIDRLIAISKKLPAERIELLETEAQFMDGLTRRYLVVALTLGALDRFVQGDSIRMLRRAGARTMVALELYRASHGRYPDSLDRLAPAILPDPPSDPLHGLPLGYRLLIDDPHGRPYLLYSVGLDRQDDGGQDRGLKGRPALTDPDSDQVDFVINRPRDDWDE